MYKYKEIYLVIEISETGHTKFGIWAESSPVVNKEK